MSRVQVAHPASDHPSVGDAHGVGAGVGHGGAGCRFCRFGRQLYRSGVADAVVHCCIDLACESSGKTALTDEK